VAKSPNRSGVKRRPQEQRGRSAKKTTSPRKNYVRILGDIEGESLRAAVKAQRHAVESLGKEAPLRGIKRGTAKPPKKKTNKGASDR